MNILPTITKIFHCIDSWKSIMFWIRWIIFTSNSMDIVQWDNEINIAICCHKKQWYLSSMKINSYIKYIRHIFLQHWQKKKWSANSIWYVNKVYQEHYIFCWMVHCSTILSCRCIFLVLWLPNNSVTTNFLCIY